MQNLILTNNDSFARPIMAAGFGAIFPCSQSADVFVGIKVDDLYKDFPVNKRLPFSDLILASRICV